MINYLYETIRKSWVSDRDGGSKIMHDPTELISRAVQPILWLGIFGEALVRCARFRRAGSRICNSSHRAFSRNRLSSSPFFTVLYIIMDRDTGILQKLLVTPTPRLALSLGQDVVCWLTRSLPGSHRFYLRAHSRHSMHITFWSISWGDRYRSSRRGCLYRYFHDHRLHRKNTRTVHGHWAGHNASAILRLERNLSDFHHACLAPSRGEHKSTELYGGWLRSLMLPGGTGGVGIDIFILAAVALVISMISAWMYPKVVI